MRGWCALRCWSCLPGCVLGSAAGPGTAGPHLRHLPADRSAREDGKAGHHRRYRRQEPARSSANGRGRERGSPTWSTNLTRLGAVVDRVRRRVLRARPAQSRPRRRPASRNLDEATREKLRTLPSNDQILAEAIRRSRVVLGESGLAGDAGRARQEAAGDRVGDARRGAAERFMFEFPGPAAQHARAGASRRRPRPVHDQARARRHRPARADDPAGPGHDHALAQLRNAAGRHRHATHPDQGPTRPASRASRSRAFEIPTDSNGQLWVHYARGDPSIYVSAIDVLENTRAARQRSRASWC